MLFKIINKSKETDLGKIDSTIKDEIQRLAKHEVRTVFRPLRKEVRGMKLKLSNLIKGFAPLNRWVNEIAQSKSKEPRLAPTLEEVKASRLTPKRIRNLRMKLGISQRELGILVGATIGAILAWEKGKYRPTGEKKAALVALRKVRKRDVHKMLMGKAGPRNEGRNFQGGKGQH